MQRSGTLVLNPGSTSTKVSLFYGEDETCTEALRHTVEELSGFTRVADQAPYRRRVVDEFLQANGIALSDLAAVIGRGGLLRPLESGVYRVNEKMVADLLAGTYGEHASNLGAILARELAAEAGCEAFIADPVVVDEMCDEARLSGLPELPRRSIFHALNQKSAAREAAAQLGKAYEDCNLIVAHMGGGCSVGAHEQGRVIDVNNALDGEGPLSPERAGTVPAGQLVELTLAGTHTRDQIKKMLTGRGGFVAYCGTNSLEDLNGRIRSGDHTAALAHTAFIYQVSKEIAAHGATLRGSVDGVVLTGGMAYDADLTAAIEARISFLAPVVVIPGEREMLSLARAARAALDSRTPIKEY